MSGAPDNTNSPGSNPDQSLIGNQPTATPTPEKTEGVKEVTPQPEKKEGEVEKKAEAPQPLTADAIKIPDGMQIDEPLRDEFLKVMNNAELSPKDRAQALIDLQAKAMQAVSERGNKLWLDVQEKAKEQARAEFGASLEPMLGNISKLIDEYGGTAEQVKELRDAFTVTGMGNQPALVRFLDNLGKPLREGTAKAGTVSGQRTPEQILYPNMAQG